MHTEVTIVATTHRSAQFSASGGVTVRQTGWDALHLVNTAATPLGGDTIEIRVTVESGARLSLRTVAAAIALPSAHRVDSVASWHLTVEPGGYLFLDPQPTVVAAGAQHLSSVSVEMSSQSAVTIAECSQVGRRSAAHHEADAKSRWTGSLRVDVDGVALLRHRIALGADTPTPGRYSGLASVFRFPDGRPESVNPTDFAARLSLAGGGSLTTALGQTAAQARILSDRLAR